MIQQKGFTLVELMITLFVGVLFLLSGYQLYGAVNTRSGNIRQMSEASNIGYEVLRKEGSNVSGSFPACSASPTPESVSRTSTTLPGLSVTMVRCQPFTDLNKLIQVTVTVKYGNSSPQKEVVHATYVAKS